MAVVRPFRAIRPTSELAAKVAALPYDVMNTEEARQMVVGNPYSFLHVDKAEIDLDPSVDHYDKIVYETARKNLDKMSADGVYIQDDAPCFYLYKQVMDGRPQVGIVACASIDDYMNNIIKKHELTRADKEEDRVNHVDYCNANTGPIFLTYKARSAVNAIVEKTMAGAPVYDFVAEGVQNTVWVINDAQDIATISKEFDAAGNLYIADGHHRCASAARVGKMRREQNPSYTGQEEFNFFLAVLFPDEQLHIMDYNRVVKDLNGMSEEQFMDELKKKFHLKEFCGQGQYRPENRHSFGMYMDGKWYIMTAHGDIFDANDPVDQLDVSILQKNVLDPLLGIQDPRTDSRIDFIGGIRGLGELEKRVKEGMKVAFAMYPTSIEELIDIADAGKIMPPKSTWFEPKLMSGLFVHQL